MELYFKILEKLSIHGIGEEADISKEFENYLLTPKDVADMFYNGERIDKIKEFLEVMKCNKHLKYHDLSPSANKELTEEEKEKYRKEGRVYQWVKPIKITAQISNDGLDYYYNHVLKTATVRSFKNQFKYNLITWGIAIVSIAFSVFLAVKNSDLSNRVTALEKERQQPKFQQHSTVASGKTQHSGK